MYITDARIFDISRNNVNICLKVNLHCSTFSIEEHYDNMFWQIGNKFTNKLSQLSWLSVIIAKWG